MHIEKVKIKNCNKVPTTLLEDLVRPKLVRQREW